MKEYLLALLAASLCAMLIGFLTPSGSGGGLSGHVKLLLSLFLVCVLVTPLGEAANEIRDWLSGDFPFFDTEEKEENYREQLENSLTDASKGYFIQMLTQTIREKFSLEDGTVRCMVEWSHDSNEPTPARVTVLLSGKSIWKDPHAIKDYTEDLLQCECIVAIE